MRCLWLNNTIINDLPLTTDIRCWCVVVRYNCRILNIDKLKLNFRSNTDDVTTISGLLLYFVQSNKLLFCASTRQEITSNVINWYKYFQILFLWSFLLSTLYCWAKNDLNERHEIKSWINIYSRLLYSLLRVSSSSQNSFTIIFLFNDFLWFRVL